MADDDLAFPCPETDRNFYQPGMLLRDYFAASALQGLLAADVGDDKWHTYEAIIKQAWSLADAMLAARKAKP